MIWKNTGNRSRAFLRLVFFRCYKVRLWSRNNAREARGVCFPVTSCYMNLNLNPLRCWGQHDFHVVPLLHWPWKHGEHCDCDFVCPAASHCRTAGAVWRGRGDKRDIIVVRFGQQARRCTQRYCLWNYFCVGDQIFLSFMCLSSFSLAYLHLRLYHWVFSI